LRRRLVGQTIREVNRRAKYLFLEVGENAVMIHLGMSGSLRIVATEDSPLAHDHVDIVLDDGAALRYRDPRRFGSIHWVGADRAQHALLKNLGPEPLSDEFSGERLFRLSRKRKIAVKNFIMDSAIVVGVGNIYACEALFKAGIRPDRPAGRVSSKRYAELCATIKETLEHAISAGGTTLRDFVNADGSPGYFAQRLDVYGREGESCVACETGIVRRQVLGQRSTFFCVRCQS